MPASTLTAMASAPAVSVAPERPRLPSGEGRVHMVKSGESLRSVARAQGIDVADLADYNAMQTGEPLLPGQSLRVPGAGSGTREAEMVTHRVQKGDSLGGIARRYGVTVNDLRRWNPSGASALRNGGVIRIYRRGGESA
jgi:membrane-bound lytic murein transglycosylase D